MVLLTFINKCSEARGKTVVASETCIIFQHFFMIVGLILSPLDIAVSSSREER